MEHSVYFCECFCDSGNSSWSLAGSALVSNAVTEIADDLLCMLVAAISLSSNASVSINVSCYTASSVTTGMGDPLRAGKRTVSLCEQRLGPTPHGHSYDRTAMSRPTGSGVASGHVGHSLLEINEDFFTTVYMVIGR